MKEKLLKHGITGAVCLALVAVYTLTRDFQVLGLVAKFRILWYHDNKPHGFDVQEVRLGGLVMRLRSQRDRLTD